MGTRITILLLTFFLSSCAPQSPTSTAAITVMAAASLTSAFTEIGAEFEKQNPGLQVDFNFAGSQQLAQQIAQGAPADVFASANQAQMDAALTAGAVAPGAAREFARNQLVVILPVDNPGGINTLPDLARPGLKIVLAAPEVPAGQYALAFLDNAARDPSFGASYRADVLQNIVSYEDSVKGVLTKVALGEADAGIVYATDASAAPVDSLAQLDIPGALNVVAGYPIAVIQASQHPELARSFIDFVLSPFGQDILKKYGFLPRGPR